MPRLDISTSPYRLNVLAVVLYKSDEKVYYHFNGREQAMKAMIKVERLRKEEEIHQALIKICGEDYYSPLEEASKSRGIHSSSSSNGTSS